MRHWIVALTLLSLLLINTLALIIPMLLIALLRCIPIPGWRKLCSRGVLYIAESWVERNKRQLLPLLPTRWHVHCDQPLSRNRSYLVISNHLSWVDIPALLQALGGQVPFFRFFLKQELFWVPLLGLAFWALDYPFMKRYSPAFLERRPHLRGKDLEITRRACQRFQGQPITLVNYLEGTRCTPGKQAAQASPYRHLLQPKTGGLAYAINMLGSQFDTLLDVTMLYPGPRIPGFWKLLSGQVSDVHIHIRTRKIPEDLLQDGNLGDPEYRERIRQWVDGIWQEKDRLISDFRQQHP